MKVTIYLDDRIDERMVLDLDLRHFAAYLVSIGAMRETYWTRQEEARHLTAIAELRDCGLLAKNYDDGIDSSLDGRYHPSR